MDPCDYVYYYIDNGQLNKVVVKNKYHLPNIDEFFNQLQRTYLLRFTIHVE